MFRDAAVANFNAQKHETTKKALSKDNTQLHPKSCAIHITVVAHILTFSTYNFLIQQIIKRPTENGFTVSARASSPPFALSPLHRKKKTNFFHQQIDTLYHLHLQPLKMPLQIAKKQSRNIALLFGVNVLFVVLLIGL